MELLHEGIDVQLDLKYELISLKDIDLEQIIPSRSYLIFKELILQGLLSGVGAGSLKALLVVLEPMVTISLTQSLFEHKNIKGTRLLTE